MSELNEPATARETALLILAGFILAVWMKAPTELFVAYVIGIVGKSVAFLWGSSKEKQAEVQKHELDLKYGNTTTAKM